MEEFPKPENSQEKIEKGKVLEMLRANGLEHPETKEMVMRWTEQQEASVEKENTSRAGIIFNERTDLYLAVGDMSGALENLEDARMQVHQENDIELYEKIMKKMDEIEARSVEVGEGVGEAEIQVQEKQTEKSATRRHEELTQAKELLAEIKFEGQFAHKEKFLINGATVESVDINSENPKTEVPILVAPGFAATMDSFKPGMKVLMESERRVISLDHPRRGGIIPNSFNEEVEKYPNEELRKAHTILGLLEQKNIEKVDVVAHSEAAINVCIAAMLHPEKFRNIVLYSPAGLIGNDTLFRLIKGVMTHPKRPESMSTIPVTEAETEYLASTAKIGPDYQMANPLRAAKEVLAISQTQIEDMLRYLREKGIHVVVIAAVDDTMFPMDKYQKNVGTSFVDGFLSVRGGYMQIQVHPELYMGAAESMLSALEEKEKNQKNIEGVTI